MPRLRLWDDCISARPFSMTLLVCARGGIANINIDLIAGLPHQTAESWQQSLDGDIAIRRASCQRLHAGSGRGFALGT